MTLETREVLADAYPRGYTGDYLKHVVEVDSHGRVLRVLCRRVKLDNLADRYAGNPHDRPTCPNCIRAAKKPEPR